MGKINKKIGRIGVICLFLTIVNMYIIPLIILHDDTVALFENLPFAIGLDSISGVPRSNAVQLVLWDAEDLIKAAMVWICGLGGIVQILIHALYKKNEKSKKEFMFWAALAAYVPIFLAGAIYGYIYICFGGMLLQPVYAAAGRFFANLMSGKYKGKKPQIGDILFALICAAISVWLCFSQVNISKWEILDVDLFYIDKMVYAVVGVFAAAAVYSRMTEFEYFTDAFAKAASLVYFIFMPVGLFCSDTYDNSEIVEIILYNIPVLLLLYIYSAVLGVIAGYILRILKFGGEEMTAKVPFLKRVKTVFTAVCIIALLIGGIKVYNKYRYRFCRLDTNVWQELNVNEDDIYMLEVSDGSAADTLHEGVFTTDKAAIHGFAEAAAGEKCADTDDFPYESHEGKGYRVIAYDKNFEQLFYISMYSRSAGELYISRGSEENEDYDFFFIPDQYYGAATMADTYTDIVKNAPIGNEEKKSIIKNTIMNYDYLEIRDRLLETTKFEKDEKIRYMQNDEIGDIIYFFSTDSDSDVRLEAAKLLGMWRYDWSILYLGKLIHDDEAEVRAEACYSLGMVIEPNERELVGELYIAMLKDPYPKARFCAALAWGSGVKEVWGRTETAVKSRQDEAIRLFEEEQDPLYKLGYACALVKMGNEEYRAEAEKLLENIEDEDIRNKAENYLR